MIHPGEGLDKVIPPGILDKAQGLAIYTVLKAGFLFSGRAGSGLVVARLPDGNRITDDTHSICNLTKAWSAPSAIGTGGMGAGGQIGSVFEHHEHLFEKNSIGAELTDFVLVLNNKEAVKTFSHFGNVTLGTNVSVAAGPVGRNAEASGSATFKHIAAIYSYSKTKGLFAGVSLEGSVILTRNDANEKFYGKKVTPKELLNGTVPPPREADVLYRALNAKFHMLGSTGAMYQRNSEEGSSVYRSTSISAPGTLKTPPVQHQNNNHSYNGYTPPPPPPMNPTYGNGFPQPAAAPPSNAYQSSAYQQPSPPQQQTSPPPYGNPPVHFNPNPTKRAIPPPPPPLSRKPAEPTAQALYAYNGEQAGDLSFQEGEIITIIQKSDSQDDWWTGKIGTRQGVFPANYVKLL
ncbi:hypothetical protein EC973_004963 [Apophysomyces ossiformis]|uniref:SH3 domain-containing protein n=1 Tax=Apophysomyces ossiformis TaxID=679940 RepID=A0A8H7BGE2_9FUNG|nr:hypothetical protein EC973_004963 [Apophysomyces ossiformis]